MIFSFFYLTWETKQQFLAVSNFYVTFLLLHYFIQLDIGINSDVITHILW